MLIASSYSKNFGLYNERVGRADPDRRRRRRAADAALSQIKTVIRANYSNPPAHGAKIVTMILRSPELRGPIGRRGGGDAGSHSARCGGASSRSWRALGVERDFSFIERQHGMFSFTGLTKDQVHALRERHAIYIVDSGGSMSPA